eukprot:SAG31_NODE_828_length_11716_cov_4.405785_3_plen_181_part_00
MPRSCMKVNERMELQVCASRWVRLFLIIFITTSDSSTEEALSLRSRRSRIPFLWARPYLRPLGSAHSPVWSHETACACVATSFLALDIPRDQLVLLRLVLLPRPCVQLVQPRPRHHVVRQEQHLEPARVPLRQHPIPPRLCVPDQAVREMVWGVSFAVPQERLDQPLQERWLATAKFRLG